MILPHALAYNAPAEPDVMKQIAGAIGKTDAPGGLFDLIKELGGPLSLKELGMREEQIDHVVGQLLARPYWNPRSLEMDALRYLLRNAFEGNRPG